MADPTQPDDGTEAADMAEAGAAHQADRAPTPDEEEAAARGARRADRADPEDVAAHERDMGERGARAEGEGRIP
ncbi:MAG: hypothetical protein ACRDZR_02065 [Acidimicrobiales bacterium]